MMVDVKKVPQKGILYIVSTGEILYKPYRISNGIIEVDGKAYDICEDALLELHMFDSKKEYRMIKSRVKGGFMECEVTDDFPHDDIYEEDMCLIKKSADDVAYTDQKVGIVNYIQFDENDLLRIVNYRMKEVC